jgi:hypothetical protein
MTKAIVIPADATQPLRWADHPNDDYKDMTALVFDGDRDGGTYSLSIVGRGDREVSLWYDDNGLARLDNEKLPDIINLRAMQIWASLDGGLDITDFSVPLIGTYVVTGQADDDGNSMDAPAWVMEFPFNWHEIYVVTEREEGE